MEDIPLRFYLADLFFSGGVSGGVPAGISGAARCQEYDRFLTTTCRSVPVRNCLWISASCNSRTLSLVRRVPWCHHCSLPSGKTTAGPSSRWNSLPAQQEASQNQTSTVASGSKREGYENFIAETCFLDARTVSIRLRTTVRYVLLFVLSFVGYCSWSAFSKRRVDKWSYSRSILALLFPPVHYSLALSAEARSSQNGFAFELTDLDPNDTSRLRWRLTRASIGGTTPSRSS